MPESLSADSGPPGSWSKPPFLRSCMDLLIEVAMRKLTVPTALVQLSGLLGGGRGKLFSTACLTRWKILGIQLLTRARDTSHIRRISDVTLFPVHR